MRIRSADWIDLFHGGSFFDAWLAVGDTGDFKTFADLRATHPENVGDWKLRAMVFALARKMPPVIGDQSMSPPVTRIPRILLMKNGRQSVVSLCLITAGLLPIQLGQVAAQDSTNEPAKSRSAIRDQRPDESRGWVVVSKQSYWPLCYESLDRIETARALIGSDDRERTADALDKCGAWLRLAASASMTDGTSGVEIAADAFHDAANSIRDESSDWSDAELRDLTTLGLVLMAKSHVLRADAPDQEFVAPAKSVTAKVRSSVELKNAESDISRENTDRRREQYLYDMIESCRHLNVAQTYLEAAGKAGSFKVSSELTRSVAEPKQNATASELVEHIDYELRPQIIALSDFLEKKQTELTKNLSDRL